MVLPKHFVATAYVYDSDADRFLLVLHRKLGKWLPPGGHLNAGEEPYQGALRELLEETGVEGRIVDLLQTPEVGTRTVPQLPSPFCMLSETIPAGPGSEEHLHIDFVYVVEIDLSAALNLFQEEVALATWVAADQIDHLETYENVQQVCRAISSMSKAKR